MPLQTGQSFKSVAEQLIEEGMEKGIKRGMEKGIEKMLLRGFPAQEVAEIMDVSLALVKRVQARLRQKN